MSTTQVGSIATFTSQLPVDPCGIHKLGDTRTRTVVGFAIATTPFNMGDDGVKRIQNEKRADLTDAIVSDFTISGRKITDFYANPEDYVSLNWQDNIHYRRTFKLGASIEFTPQDSASITVNNVKILNKGTINPEFALLEPNGQFCLGAKYTVLTLGNSKQGLPAIEKKSLTISKIPSPTLVLYHPTSKLTPTTLPSRVTSNESQSNTKEKELSAFEKIINWLFSFIRN